MRGKKWKQVRSEALRHHRRKSSVAVERRKVHPFTLLFLLSCSKNDGLGSKEPVITEPQIGERPKARHTDTWG